VSARRLLRRLTTRFLDLARKLIVLSVFGLSVAVVAMMGTLQHTAKPEFCVSCHIMEPYYESWKNSGHSDVACIECHYEPGAVETLEGKFKALSQLAKYVTRTQGTKPWAEVSDQSCMRSGCHTVRMLEGPLQFGRVRFDHRHHLLESRRGRRLRCVTCHSQIVQGEHLTVTESVCFTCHFMPGPDHKISEKTGDCLMCHGPPKEAIEVAGRPFEHREYVGRGVNCRECHDPVVEGDGMVRKERCHSCHAEVGHIERIAETQFLHEMHVTEHKVECFECHDEIRHGLLELEPPDPKARGSCGSCHSDPHHSVRDLYAGRGAVGVEDDPSRMYQTRVHCEACHTGRSARKPGDGAHGPAGDVPPGHAPLAAAGAVDCIHCHGPGFDGMLEEWQGAVGGRLAHLGPLLDALEQKLPPDADHPARELYRDARRNVELVARDGSRGAHNVTYALDALHAAAERIDGAYAALGGEPEARAVAGAPFRSDAGCSECHLGVGREGSRAELAFPHARHVQKVGLDCARCHSVEEHGRPSFPRTECASCHHQETDELDPWECARCHESQVQFVAGRVEGFDELPSGMEDKECTDCHGEPPALAIPKPGVCGLCHDEGDYGEKLDAWRLATDELRARVQRALASAPRRGLDPAGIAVARDALRAVDRDGSRGVHNHELARLALERALSALGEK